MNLKYSVTTFRAAGLQAKWTKNSKGAPIIVARNPKAIEPSLVNTWWHVDAVMWEKMTENGVMNGFVQCTLLGHLFSVKV